MIKLKMLHKNTGCLLSSHLCLPPHPLVTHNPYQFLMAEVNRDCYEKVYLIPSKLFSLFLSFEILHNLKDFINLSGCNDLYTYFSY